ncbi:MAG TPA: TlpA disulfide reductase family protein [Saprospiraceae bacterium]|nr:TlpA disulfide reductase family protein [Saprospiraceae bacterium]
MIRKFFILYVLLNWVFSYNIFSQEYPFSIYKNFEELQKNHIQVSDDRIHVINFWATWCAPCIKEMPFIDALTSKYGNQIKVTFVSLDFPKRIDTALIPFLEKSDLKSEVVLLDDARANRWIDLVDPDWSGAIPATLIIKNGKRAFYEREFHSFEEIESVVLKLNQ